MLVVPDRLDLLDLKDEQGKELKTLLKNAFDARGVRGELMPEIKVSGPYEGKKIDLAGVLQDRRKANTPRSDALADWWSESQRPENAQICTVCARRPVGYPIQGSPIQQDLGLDSWADQGKAERRNVCRVCLNRRGRRAKSWARNEKPPEEKFGTFERTIWAEEVADDNGRFALVVGRFVLAGWTANSSQLCSSHRHSLASAVAGTPHSSSGGKYRTSSFLIRLEGDCAWVSALATLSASTTAPRQRIR